MGMMMRGEKPRDFKGTMRKLLQALRPYRWSFAVAILFAMASTVFNIIGPKILGKATTKLFEGVMAQLAGTGQGIDFAYIGNILLTMAGLYLLATLFGYVQGWILAGVSARVTYRFRRDIAEKINRLPLRYFDGTNQGEVLSRVTNDVDTVSQTLNQSLSQIITSAVTVVGVLVMMLTISWQMTLVTLMIIPLSLVFIQQIVGRSQKYFKQQQDYLGHVNGHVEEMYGGHLVMKAFNGEEKSVAKFDVLGRAKHQPAVLPTSARPGGRGDDARGEADDHEHRVDHGHRDPAGDDLVGDGLGLGAGGELRAAAVGEAEEHERQERRHPQRHVERSRRLGTGAANACARHGDRDHQEDAHDGGDAADHPLAGETAQAGVDRQEEMESPDEESEHASFAPRKLSARRRRSGCARDRARCRATRGTRRTARRCRSSRCLRPR